MNKPIHPYQNQEAVIATKHEKGRLIASTFAEHLDIKIREINIDTDQLGTFSGEVERVGSAREVVVKKAKLGLTASGVPLGMASEGSIGADPLIPFINSDIELMAFVDQERGITIVESLRSTEIIAQTIKVNQNTDIEKFVAKADFPNHRLILRAADDPTKFCIKGINERKVLEREIARGLKDFPELLLESDLRAHCSPSRQKNIAALAEKLAFRLSHLCPECSSPGWGLVDYKKGLPCEECGEISEESIAREILGCTGCGFNKEGKILAESIDPARCQLCNP